LQPFSGAYPQITQIFLGGLSADFAEEGVHPQISQITQISFWRLDGGCCGLRWSVNLPIKVGAKTSARPSVLQSISINRAGFEPFQRSTRARAKQRKRKN
jgi:hypothetical protein